MFNILVVCVLNPDGTIKVRWQAQIGCTVVLMLYHRASCLNPQLQNTFLITSDISLTLNA